MLAGKVVLVTGASRGIGRAIALRLAREMPAHIFVGYCLHHDAAAETVATIERAGVPATAIAADVGQIEFLQEMFQTIGDRCGRLDVFVSNAARASFRLAEETTARAWERTMDINARAFLLASQLSAQLMTAGGSIVGLSSLGSHFYAPGYLALGAAKAAIEATARYLAVELAPKNINVNVVCGGLIETETARLHPRYEELKRAVISRTPEGRVGTPDDLAGVVAFLSSPEARWIRGQTIVVDGGFSLVS